MRIAEKEFEKTILSSQRDSEIKLQECLENVEADYIRRVELNTVAAPKENYPDARRWNNSQVKLDTEKKYNDDRDFCLKLYN